MDKYSFKREEKILKRSDFIRLSKKGKKIDSKYFIAAVAKNCFDKTRLGITVTKKSGCAVKRNKIKRYVREYFRQHKHTIFGIWDINIIAKREATDLSFNQTQLSLQKIFNTISRERT